MPDASQKRKQDVAAARRWRSVTTVTAQRTAQIQGPAPRLRALRLCGADGDPPAAVPARARPTARPRRLQWRYGPAIRHADEQPGACDTGRRSGTPTSSPVPACLPILTAAPLSVQMFGDALRRLVAACGADTQRFSGISARKDGLSTAGVSEDILYLQSGHSPALAARNYMHLQDPHRIFDTFRALNL